MASRRSDTMTSQPSLTNSGKPGAVQKDHRKRIGSMRQNNCDPAPMLADSSLKKPTSRNPLETCHARPTSP
jgi:hypothetical protein